MGRSQCKLRRAISRLWVVVLIHRNFAGDRRAVGGRRSVGRRIFSIGGGLSCVGGRSRECGLRLLVWLSLCQPRRLRMLV